MRERYIDLLFRLIKKGVCDPETEIGVDSFSESDLEKLYKLSDKFDLAHIIAHVLSENGMLSNNEISAKFEQKKLLALYRREMHEFEVKRVCEAFEELQVKNIPLKGTVLCHYYPETWLRTSCDIDILIKHEDLERVREHFIDKMGYTQQITNMHDVSFYTKDNVHIELHYDLIEPGRAGQAELLSEKIWEGTRSVDGWKYRLEIPREIFYVYHIAHMAKHFDKGGCGIRPFLDLWLIENKMGYDSEVVSQMLREIDLELFSRRVEKMAGIWFSSEEYDDISRELERFVVSGGVYGSVDNEVAVKQTRLGGKKAYAFSRIFISPGALACQYPILKKHKWFLPFMHVRRWCRLIFCGRFKRSMNELKMNQNVSSENFEKTKKFIEQMGL